MRCPRLLSLSLTCLLIAFEGMTLPAQTNSVVHLKRPSAIPNAQPQTALADAQIRPDVAKLFSFAPAVTYDAGFYPGTVVLGDVNGDGKLDMVVTAQCQDSDCDTGSGVNVLLGNGDGTFQAPVYYSSGGSEGALAIGDLNGDGYLDLVLAGCPSANGADCYPYTPGGVAVLLGNGDGTFQSPVSYSTSGTGGAAIAVGGVAIGDLNGDGIPDLVVVNPCQTGTNCNQGVVPGGVSVLLGNGDGTFQPAVTFSSGGYYGSAVALADLNGDGNLDLAVSNLCQSETCNNGGVNVLMGNGDGTFQSPMSLSSGAYGAGPVAIGDLNGDGKLDLVVDNECGHYTDLKGCMDKGLMSVMLGNGDGTFQAAVSYPSHGTGERQSVVIGDVNGDGHPDLVVGGVVWGGTGDPGAAGVLLGNGDGTFQSIARYKTGGSVGGPVVIGDLNGDGRPDLAAVNEYQFDNYNDGGVVGVLLNTYAVSTTTAVTSSINPANVNQAVTFTATISSTYSVPNGQTVTFYNGKTAIGTGTTRGGVASLNTSFSQAKTYTIKASYSGAGFLKASSGTVKQVVSK